MFLLVGSNSSIGSDRQCYCFSMILFLNDLMENSSHTCTRFRQSKHHSRTILTVEQ